MKRFAQWVAVMLATVAVMVIARQPEFWQRYGRALVQGSDLPVSFYEPRERVEGGNEPPAPRVSPALESLDPAALQLAADYAADRGTRALIVTRHGHIVFERYWRGTDFNTLEDSQPLITLATALLTGIAIGDRRIGWPDEPIGNFIPEWRNDARGSITVRNLLKRSSGLAPPGSPVTPWSAAARERFGPDITAEYLQQRLVATPGATWTDQAADAQLLSLVIERAAGTRFSEYLSVALWRRIGAADGWLWLDREGGTAHADCCFLARQGDWIRVGELLVDNGRYQGDEIVPPGWVAQMLPPAQRQPMAEAYAAKDLVAVGGGGHRLWVVPSMHLVILRAGAAVHDWDDSRIPNAILRGARDYVPPQARPGVDLSTLVPNH